MNWEYVCTPKSIWGLGVRGLWLVNHALLEKWNWRLLVWDSWLWRDIITTTYITTSISSLSGGRVDGFQSSSFWWKNVSLLGNKEEWSSNWFSVGIVRKVGSSFHTSFWKDHWLGRTSLKTKFLGLFFNFLLPERLVGEIGVVFNRVLT